MAALAYAVYVVGAKAVVAQVPPFAITGLSFGLAGIALLAPAVLAEPNLWAAARPVWVHVAYLGVVPTALAYTVYILGLRRTSATAAGVATLLEPLTATLLGLVLFGESLGWPGALGAILLLGGVTSLGFGERQ